MHEALHADLPARARDTAGMKPDRLTADALGSAISIEKALARFGWLGDYDEILDKIGISRDKLRALEADDEISAALETRRFAAINTPWRIEHPQARARMFLNEAFAGIADTFLTGAWSAVPYGYAVFEIVYRQEAGRIVPDQAILLPFEWFRIAPDGRLYWRESGEEALPPKFMAVIHNGSLRKPHGEALLAKAYWPWFFRTHGWRFWAKFLEQAAIPLLVGKTHSEREATLATLRAISQGPVMVTSPDETVEALDLPGNSANKFTEFEIAICRRIQRLILGQTLTSGTDGGSGNRALGEVHAAVLAEKKRADCKLLMGAAQRLVDWTAELNALSAGAFVMEDETGLNIDRAQRDKVLVDSGVRFTRTYYEEKFGLEPDDFELGEARQTPQPAPAEAKMAAAFAARPDSLKPDRPRFTAGQQAIEDEIDRILPSLGSPIEQAAILSAIRASKDADDLMERLAVALKDADDRDFRRKFERAMFAAEIMGYAAAKREALAPA